MKKIFLMIMMICLSLSTLICQENTEEEKKNEQGILFDAGLGVSAVGRPYVYEQVSYQYIFDFGLAIGADLRAMEMLVRDAENEPYLYGQAGILMSFYGGYISGGYMFNDSFVTENYNSWYVRTGYRCNPWQWGDGRGGLDFSLEFSPTLYYTDSDNGAAVAIGTIFATVFNSFKLNCGFTYFLPF